MHLLVFMPAHQRNCSLCSGGWRELQMWITLIDTALHLQTVIDNPQFMRIIITQITHMKAHASLQRVWNSITREYTTRCDQSPSQLGPFHGDIKERLQHNGFRQPAALSCAFLQTYFSTLIKQKISRMTSAVEKGDISILLPLSRYFSTTIKPLRELRLSLYCSHPTCVFVFAAK